MANLAVVDNRISELDDAFPSIQPGIDPCGSRVLVQIRRPKRKTAGGILLTHDTMDTESDNTQVAKVLSMGPLAFKNRNTMEDWAEGKWCKPGEFIRVPKYNGDRFKLSPPGSDKGDEVTFVIIDDLSVIGKITGDPLAVKAFI